MISIVMTAYRRARQLRETLLSILPQIGAEVGEIIVVDENDPETKAVCGEFGVRYIGVNRPPSDQHRNPAYPINVGIRQARGEIVLLQNAECKHIHPETIRELTLRVTLNNAVFARVIALTEEGSESVIYCGQENPRPYFFCGAMRWEWFERLRGFDEDFKDYGYEDDDFADRLRREGVEFVFTDVLVHHQWHLSQENDLAPSRLLFEAKRNEPVVRNLNREWGKL